MEIGGIDLIFNRPNGNNEHLVNIAKKICKSYWGNVVFEWEEQFKVLDVFKNNEIYQEWEVNPSGFVSIYFGDKELTFVIDHEKPDEPRQLVNKIMEEMLKSRITHPAF